MLRRLFLLSIIVTPAAAAPDPAPLEAFLRKQKDVTSLQSEFVQERRMPSLKNPVTAKGNLWVKQPGLLRWELGAGPETIVVGDGTTLTIADVAKKRANKVSAGDQRARQFTMLSGEAFRDLDAFRRAFELRESRVTNGIYQATLRPLDRRLRSHVPWVFLDIDPATDRLRAFELELEDGSRIRSVFTNTRINPAIPASRFQIDLTGYQIR